MPTTEPLDDDLGDTAGGPLKSIAEFVTAANAPVTGQAPAAAVPTAHTRTAPVTAQPVAQRRPTTLRTPGVGLHGPRMTQQTAQPEPARQTTMATPAAPRSNPYTPADVTAAWKAFVAQHAGEHLLTSAMRAAMPVHLSNDTFRVAQSEVHIGLIRDNLARIRDYVHNLTANDNIDFTLDIVSEDSPLAWNDRELIAHIVEDNPEVGKFIETLKLSLL